jgi:hypothetical protein
VKHGLDAVRGTGELDDGYIWKLREVSKPGSITDEVDLDTHEPHHRPWPIPGFSIKKPTLGCSANGDRPSLLTLSVNKFIQENPYPTGYSAEVLLMNCS